MSSGKSMKPGIYALPPEQDQELALIKLGTQGLSIDEPTPEQIKYNDDYSAGPRTPNGVFDHPRASVIVGHVGP